MLAELYGTALGSWRIKRLPSGQPVAVQGRAAGPSISLSHSRGWVACAVCSSAQVGVDVEVARPRRNWRAIAREAFGAGEIERARTEREFYRIWTLREALAKAEGKGLDRVADGLDRGHLGPLDGTWSTMAEGKLRLLHHQSLRSTVFLSVAVVGLESAQIAEVSRNLHISVAYVGGAETSLSNAREDMRESRF